MSSPKNARSGAIVVLAVLVVVSKIASSLALTGCLVTTNLSDLSGGQVDSDAASALYAIGGSIHGLEGTEVTLVNNADDFVTIASDGPFTFPGRLASGRSYLVTVVRTSDQRTCTVERGEGAVSSADVTDIVVSCPSTNALLSGLVVSNSPGITPQLSAATTEYAAAVSPDIFALDARVTLTATTASAGATLALNGASAISGQPSAIAGLHGGVNMVTVIVTAADGLSRTSYKIVVTVNSQEAYVKAASSGAGYRLGYAAALSADGNTLVVGAPGEPTVAIAGGAVYVYRRAGTTWTQEAIVRPATSSQRGEFGRTVAVSSDGTTLAAGAGEEDGAARGINGDANDLSAARAGAAYIFRRAMTSASWTQEAYVKPSNTHASQHFGHSVSLTSDGNMLAVGAVADASAATGINGDQDDRSTIAAGAAFIFSRVGTTWTQDTYVKASNTRAVALFGAGVALSSDGSTLVVTANSESSASKGVNGDQSTGGPKFENAGAGYVFARTGKVWTQQAYLKASNTRTDGSNFGFSLALSGDGTRIAIGAPVETSASAGVNADQNDILGDRVGAVYVFARSGTTWAQEVYLKASNATALIPAEFGYHVALSGDGRKLVVGARYEQSRAQGINGDQNDAVGDYAGAAYAFLSSGTNWTQTAYIKASNTHGDQVFGGAVALSADGHTLAVGAPGEASAATGINGNQDDVTASGAGAVYVFH